MFPAWGRGLLLLRLGSANWLLDYVANTLLLKLLGLLHLLWHSLWLLLLLLIHRLWHHHKRLLLHHRPCWVAHTNGGHLHHLVALWHLWHLSVWGCQLNKLNLPIW